MKGIILAGGTGSRLRPITHTTAKQLIPLANKPVLEYVIEDLRDAGIDEIGVILGYNTPDQIQDTLRDGSDFGVDITYIMQGEPLGLAHAVGCAKEFVGEEPFVVYFGDTIVEQGITQRLVADFDPSIHDLAVPFQEVENPSRFGIADFDEDGSIQRVLEKPEDPPSNLAYIGVVGFTAKIFDIIGDMEPSWRGELELTQAIDRCITEGGTAVTRIENGLWRDVGTPTDVIKTNNILLSEIESDISGRISSDATVNGEIRLGEGSKVAKGATIHGPVAIGAETTIGSGAEVGPYVSIGDNCNIIAGELTDSVVLDGIEVDCQSKISESLVGNNVVISEKAAAEGQTRTLIVGDDTEVTF